MSALCAHNAADHGLAAPEMLGEGAEAAREVATRLGLAPRHDAPALLRRLDLAVDVTVLVAACDA